MWYINHEIYNDVYWKPIDKPACYFLTWKIDQLIICYFDTHCIHKV